MEYFEDSPFGDRAKRKDRMRNDSDDKLNLTEKQVAAFYKLWWIYGNDGKKCTLFNHKLVQGFYEHRENRIEAYREGNKNMIERRGKEYAEKNGVTEECIKACEDILNNP